MKRNPKWKDFESYLHSLHKGGRIAELGVYHGTKTRVVYDILKPMHMVWVDWWKAYSNANQPQEFWDEAKRDAVGKFREEIASGDITIHHGELVGMASAVRDDSLRFIRHDADEREARVLEVFRAYWPKLRAGGIWMGHGFECRQPWSGTIPAVVQHLREEPKAELLGVLKDQSHFCLRKGA
jgi:hypothetical protein